jgi:hypothetical protein
MVEVAYCDEASLAYAAARRRFAPGEALRFDESYRLAHLPLIAPSHPAVLRSAAGTDYQDGRYDRERYALVVPVSFGDLAASASFQAVDAALRKSSFADKIAFDLCERRASKLHVTLGSGLVRSELDQRARAVARQVARLGALRFKLLGPFLGSKNTGRIYFPAYPENVDGQDVFGLIQDALGVARTRFYVLGYYNLAEELAAEETSALQHIVDENQAEVLRVQSEACFIQATNDDLVLSGRAVIAIDASGAVRPVGG